MINYQVHPSAIIDEGARIGQGSKIWHWTHISGSAVIGDNCSFGQNVYIADRVTIGNKVKIQNNVSVYEGVTLEDEVFCGPSMVFTNVTNPRSGFSRYGHYDKTLVKKGATLGANCTIVCGVTLGEYCFVAAGAVVTKDVPDYALMAGVPAKQIAWVTKKGDRISIEYGQSGSFECPESYEKYSISNKSCFIQSN